MKTTVEIYKKAYNQGVNDRKSGDYSLWQTQALRVAYELGYEGKEINFDDVVDCERAGAVPAGGISYNFRDKYSEQGCSVINVKGEKPVSSVIWFADRKMVEVTGIRLPYRGSDGETLILPLGIEEYDF